MIPDCNRLTSSGEPHRVWQFVLLTWRCEGSGNHQQFRIPGRAASSRQGSNVAVLHFFVQDTDTSANLARAVSFVSALGPRDARLVDSCTDPKHWYEQGHRQQSSTEATLTSVRVIFLDSTAVKE